jgi:uncharacterized lipoprotein
MPYAYSYALPCAIAAAGALVLAGCDVEKTQEGNVDLPKYEQTQSGSVQMPKYEVTAPEVTVGSKQETVTVPTVDVKTAEEKKAEKNQAAKP